MRKIEERQSTQEGFLNRKRAAVENLVEDVYGPFAQLDELVLGKPPLNDEQSKDSDNPDHYKDK